MTGSLSIGRGTLVLEEKSKDGLAPCATATTLEDLINERLTPVARAQLVEHLGTCDRCSAVVAQLLTLGSASTLAPSTESGPKAGERLGRYVVVEPLGRGGMGTVYRAFDPVLARQVALKVLHGFESRDPMLLNEARALAQLSHPNVVHVHEVVTEGATTFLVMELVAGQTLAQWLNPSDPVRLSSSKPVTGYTLRPWHQVLEKLLAAARGLEAVHAAGMAHGDFKPSNVLLGANGSVKVADFGLGRAVVVDESVMPTGLRGTPAYMAPEVAAGGAADASSDQFSFCVTLHEALYGHRPADPRPAARAEPRVPRWLQRTVQRGMGPRESRFASMSEVVSALSRDRRRGLHLAVGATVTVLAMAGIGVAGWVHARQQAQLCQDADRHLTGVWQAPQKENVHAAFSASKALFAERSFAEVSRVLDGWVAHWVAARVEVCEATRLRGEQSEAMLDARIACLDRRLFELRAVSTALQSADSETVTSAPVMVSRLRAPEGCVMGPVLEVPARVPEAIERGLAEVLVLRLAGKRTQALAAAKVLVSAVDGGPGEGEAVLLLAKSEDSARSYADAEQHYHQALVLAEKAGDDSLAIRSEARLGSLLAEKLRRGDEGLKRLELAKARLQRVGPSPELEADLDTSMGQAYASAGRFPEAEAALRRAVASFGDGARGNPQLLSAASFDLAMLLAQMGRVDEALELGRKALALVVAQVGENHPLTAEGHLSLSRVSSDAGRVGDAEREISKAIEIFEANGSDSSLRAAEAHETLGAMLVQQGQLEEAGAELSRAQAMFEEKLGPDSIEVAHVIMNSAAVYGLLGQVKELIPMLQRAVTIFRAGQPPNVSVLSTALGNLGEALTMTGKVAEGLALSEEATQLQEKMLGPDNPRLTQYLLSLGHAQLEAGKPEGAVPVLERAYAFASGGPGPAAVLLVQSQQLLGCALVRSGTEASRGKQLLAAARTELVKRGPRAAGNVAFIDACRAKARTR